MTNPEIIILNGAPGSGKSSIGKHFVSLGKPDGARHLSIGDLKRDITSGKIPSAYAELLQQSSHPERKTGAAPNEAMIGIMEEFILANPSSLTVVDGFPRYMDRVMPFMESVKRIGANVIALAIVEVDDNLILERLAGREKRAAQKMQDPIERLTDHKVKVVPTLQVLAQNYPTSTYRLDGSLPLDVNAHQLVAIFDRHSSKQS